MDVFSKFCYEYQRNILDIYLTLQLGAQSLRSRHLEFLRPKKSQVYSNVKVMLPVFLHFNGIFSNDQ